MKPVTQKIIHNLIEKLAVKAIYVIPFIKETEKQLFLIIKNDTDPNSKPISIAEIFQEHPKCVYRIYEEAYAIDQLKEGNIFFLQGLLEKNLKYGAISTLHQNLNFKEAFKNAADLFNKEHNKALDFQEGAKFYVDKENYPQAAFMLHQAMELAFRTVELISMGKEKICHGILQHQKYIQNFVPELGALFIHENEKETQLLDLLDTAYRNVRYDRDYKISLASIEDLQHKLDSILKIVEGEFSKRYDYCKRSLESIATNKELSAAEIKKNLKQLVNSKYHKISARSSLSYYQTDILVEHPLENFYTLSSLLKVCILAIDNMDEYVSKTIPQPFVNIQHTMELVIQLLPYEEMEFLEQIINASGGLQALLEEEDIP